jgi:hypothetical protein
MQQAFAQSADVDSDVDVQTDEAAPVELRTVPPGVLAVADDVPACRTNNVGFQIRECSYGSNQAACMGMIGCEWDFTSYPGNYTGRCNVSFFNNGICTPGTGACDCSLFSESLCRTQYGCKWGVKPPPPPPSYCDLNPNASDCDSGCQSFAGGPLASLVVFAALASWIAKRKLASV